MGKGDVFGTLEQIENNNTNFSDHLWQRPNIHLEKVMMSAVLRTLEIHLRFVNLAVFFISNIIIQNL